MQKAVIGVLLLLGALALSYLVYELAVHFEIIAAAREVFVLWWQWVLTSLGPFFKVYAIRRTMSPIWKIVSRALIFLIGYELTVLVRHYAKRVVQKVSRLLQWWKTRNVVLRWGIVCVLVFMIGFFGWGLIVLPVWIPFLTPFLKKFHMLWMDLVFDPWLGPARRWFRRTMRGHRFWRVVRFPHRSLVYWIFVLLKKLGKLARKIYRARRLGLRKLKAVHIP
jgi:hypothetical protein